MWLTLKRSWHSADSVQCQQISYICKKFWVSQKKIIIETMFILNNFYVTEDTKTTKKKGHSSTIEEKIRGKRKYTIWKISPIFYYIKMLKNYYIYYSLGHFPPLLKIASKLVHSFLTYKHQQKNNHLQNHKIVDVIFIWKHCHGILYRHSHALKYFHSC